VNEHVSNPFVIRPEVAMTTHAHLRAKGEEESEGVVLWLGTFEPPTIVRAVIPEQETSAGRFRVPLRARQQLTRELASSGLTLVAQVHSHPGFAFHSGIDDVEAIPRRTGTYSLVVPDFGARAHLLDEAALYRRDDAGRWVEAPLTTLVVPETFSAPDTFATLTSPQRPESAAHGDD
jgi:hypothetical protein